MTSAFLGSRFAKTVATSLLLPLLLAVSRVAYSSIPDWVAQVAMHWLLMAAPQLPFVLVGGSSKRLRPRMWIPLAALCALLLVYQAWAQWWVPDGERHVAQLFYATLALPVAMLMIAAQLAWHLLARIRTRL
ncbi:hypothetical protein ACG04Q_18010 [Roseateles sp. DXS20W]|uniref:Transmembrane protein n=1 Tax=Pelomonas lactea TaxID=3299030 RepID=A0ABW7GNF3_9BURK